MIYLIPICDFYYISLEAKIFAGIKLFYDRINHAGLVYIVESINFGGSVLSVLKSLQNCPYQVSVDGKSTILNPVISCVRKVVVWVHSIHLIYMHMIFGKDLKTIYLHI